MTESSEVFEDPILECDPEASSELYAEAGVYTNAEHGATVLSALPTTFSYDTKNGTQTVTYMDIAAMIRVDGGTVFAHTSPFGDFNTRTERGQRSKCEEFLKNLGIWGRPSSEAEGLPVTVTVILEEYVKKADRLGEEELAQGKVPRKSHKNTITSIVLE